MREIIMTFLFIVSYQITTIHEVIIIGAGVSGIGASKVLTEHKIPHLMIEARNRIGGRIAAGTFQGLVVDEGASFLHKPNKSNPIVSLMREMNWTARPAKFEQDTTYYEGGETFTKEEKDVVSTLQELLSAHIGLKVKFHHSDLSIKDASSGFFNHIMKNQKQKYQDLLYYNLQGYANVEGGEITQISARQIQSDQTPFDMLPTGGYPKLWAAIFSKCKPDLRLNETVLQIDYSEEVVKITTSKGVHYGKKVISSLPLGVLQSKAVVFKPPLPESYSTSLFHLQSGNENKLFVSFDKPFWKQNVLWLNFVTKNQTKSRYQTAYILPAGNKSILVFFLSGDTNFYVSNLTKNQLRKDILRFLCRFVDEDINIRDLHLTNWHLDKFSLGSYTYYRVGGSRLAIQTLRKPIADKIWFIGEHTHPSLKSLVQGAYITGVEAAEQVINQEKPRLQMNLFE